MTEGPIVASGAGQSTPLVLHTSWRGRVLNGLMPVVFLTLGTAGFRGGGVVVPTILMGLGAAFALVFLIDYPQVVVIGSSGIERRCLLRTDHLPWDVVAVIARVPKRGFRDQKSIQFGEQIEGLSARPNRRGRDKTTKPARSGLVAEVGRRPHLLTDKIESRPEYDALRRALPEWAPSTVLRASRPEDDVAATFSFKRRVGAGEDSFVDRLPE